LCTSIVEWDSMRGRHLHPVSAVLWLSFIVISWTRDFAVVQFLVQ
jgi:hypothetical protein